MNTVKEIAEAHPETYFMVASGVMKDGSAGVLGVMEKGDKEQCFVSLDSKDELDGLCASKTLESAESMCEGGFFGHNMYPKTGLEILKMIENLKTPIKDNVIKGPWGQGKKPPAVGTDLFTSMGLDKPEFPSI